MPEINSVDAERVGLLEIVSCSKPDSKYYLKNR